MIFDPQRKVHVTRWRKFAYVFGQELATQYSCP